MSKGSGNTRAPTSATSRQTPYDKILLALNHIDRKEYGEVKPFTIGAVEKRMEDFANANGVVVANSGIYMTLKSLQHAERDTKKAKGIAVTKEALARFPQERRKMDLYFDATKRNFVYTDYRNKFIIDPNRELRINGRVRRVAFVTAQTVGSPSDFKGRNYTKI